MSKPRLIWGIICLTLAVLLAVLSVVLPDENLIFLVDDTDMSYIPPIILGIIGIALLYSAKSGTRKADEDEEPIAVDNEKIALNKRLEIIGWGCFLVMLGGFLFVPHLLIDKAVWSIGVGAIMLGLNIARYYYKIRMSGFTTVLGIVSLASGIAQLAGAQTLGGPTFLVIVGAYLIFKTWFDKRHLFGKAEES